MWSGILEWPPTWPKENQIDKWKLLRTSDKNLDIEYFWLQSYINNWDLCSSGLSVNGDRLSIATFLELPARHNDVEIDSFVGKSWCVSLKCQTWHKLFPGVTYIPRLQKNPWVNHEIYWRKDSSLHFSLCFPFHFLVSL